MNKPNVLLLEDEFLVAEDLKQKITQLRFTVLEHTDSGEKAVELAQKLKPDVAILDIKVNGSMNGLEAGKHIQKLGIPVVFLTTLESDEVFDLAKESAPSDYLNKPVDLLRLKRSIELAVIPSKAQQQTEFKLRGYVFLKNKNGNQRVALDDVYCLKSEGSYCRVYLQGGKNIVLTQSMRNVFDELQKVEGSDCLLRIHRSCVVNANHVSTIHGNRLKVFDLWCDVSDPYRQKVNDLFSTI